jgi:hypothetical protein
MPGFAELAGIYRYYRTFSSRIRVDFGNLDATSGTCIVCPVNFDPTANTTSFQNYLSSRSAHHRPIGAISGNGAVSVSHSTSVAHFGGATTQFPDLYSAVVTATPTNNIYWLVGAYMNNVMTTGFVVNAYIDIDVMFFELATPSV